MAVKSVTYVNPGNPGASWSNPAGVFESRRDIPVANMPGKKPKKSKAKGASTRKPMSAAARKAASARAKILGVAKRLGVQTKGRKIAAIEASIKGRTGKPASRNAGLPALPANPAVPANPPKKKSPAKPKGKSLPARRARGAVAATGGALATVGGLAAGMAASSALQAAATFTPGVRDVYAPLVVYRGKDGKSGPYLRGNGTIRALFPDELATWAQAPTEFEASLPAGIEMVRVPSRFPLVATGIDLGLGVTSATVGLVVKGRFLKSTSFGASLSQASALARRLLAGWLARRKVEDELAKATQAPAFSPSAPAPTSSDVPTTALRGGRQVPVMAGARSGQAQAETFEDFSRRLAERTGITASSPAAADTARREREERLRASQASQAAELPLLRPLTAPRLGQVLSPDDVVPPIYGDAATLAPPTRSGAVVSIAERLLDPGYAIRA